MLDAVCTNVCDDVIPRCVRVRESSIASGAAIPRMTFVNSSLMPMMRSLLCRLMSGTSWSGMACMIICKTGETGDRNVLVPTRRRAMPSVMETVTGEEERAREAIDSEGL